MPIDQLPPGMLPPGATGQPQTAATFPDIDQGGTSLTTLHFTVHGYTENEIRPISVTAESLYDKIGNDTGLYSYLASGNYNVLVYHDQNEYTQKTHLPNWSRAVAAGQTIYTYPGPDLEPAFIHELTHLIFNAFLADKAASFKWINEGLAMYEEMSKMTDSDRTAFQSSQRVQLRDNKVPFSQMTFFTPTSEERRRTDAWFQQAESVVGFLLTQGSGLNFANMLNALRSGADIDRALSDNYPGKFRSMSELENAWKITI